MHMEENKVEIINGQECTKLAIDPMHVIAKYLKQNRIYCQCKDGNIYVPTSKVSEAKSVLHGLEHAGIKTTEDIDYNL